MPSSKTAADGAARASRKSTPGADFPPVRRTWRSPARLIAAGVLLSAVSIGGAWPAEILHLRCTNPASGATWPVLVDLGHARVDGLPATIGDKWISWRDPKQGFFDLERATLRLQLRNASSTGGYFLHYQCRPE